MIKLKRLCALQWGQVDVPNFILKFVFEEPSVN